MTRRSGFTFVELLVAMAMLGALSAIAIPRYRDYKIRALVAAMQSDLGHLRIAEESHWAEHQQYTTDTLALDFRSTSDVQITITSQDLIGGYTAKATHRLVVDRQCETSMGKEAGSREPGMIHCGPLGGTGATLPAAP
jgi:prepilin-type N-terminal cleavage/methylation domain-containing protein